MTPMLPLMWRIEQAAEDALDVYFYGDIEADFDSWFGKVESETSASTFVKKLQESGNVSKINVYLNTCGGDAYEGIAICEHLSMHPAKTTAYITALAASAGSVIAMGCDEVLIGRGAQIYVHKPWTVAVGDDDELRKASDDLKKFTEATKQIYFRKTGDKLSAERMEKIYDAGGEYFNADEAIELGLADGYIEPGKEKELSPDMRKPSQNFMAQREIDGLRKTVNELIQRVEAGNKPESEPGENRKQTAQRMASLAGAFFMPNYEED